MTRRAGRPGADVVLAFTFGVTFLAVILGVAVFVTDPSPLLITVIKITLALAAAGVAATVPGFLSVSFTPAASVAVRAGGAIAVFVIVFFFTPAGLVPTSDKAALKPPQQAHAIVTPRLGLQFKQEGLVLPILRDSDESGIVALRREAFMITLPERTWKSPADDYPALQITISEKPELADLVKFGGSAEANPFFQPGTGVADYEHGSGALWAISDLTNRPFSHNYIIGGRFNVDEFERRGVYVSAILTDPSERQNLISTAKSIYMVFQLGFKNPSPDFTLTTLDVSDIDIVRLDFK